MGISQVVDVNVVTNASAIRRWVIVTKDSDALSLPESGLQYDWNQVALRVVIFAQITVRAGAGGVKVPQYRVCETVYRSVVS